MIVFAVDFHLSENVEIVVRFPSISGTNIGESIHNFVIFGGLLQIKLIARECQNLHAIGRILLEHGIEIGVLLGVGAEGGHVHDQEDLAPISREIREGTVEALDLEIINRLIGGITLFPASGFINQGGARGRIGLLLSGGRGHSHLIGVLRRGLLRILVTAGALHLSGLSRDGLEVLLLRIVLSLGG